MYYRKTHGNDISKELLDERLKRVETSATERFIKASAEAEQSAECDESIFMTAVRPNMDDRDSIALERILGKSDLFPIAYLQSGLDVSKAVCRISIANRYGAVVGYGTGFLVSPNLIMTNNHVLGNYNDALYAIAEFNYQEDAEGRPCPTDNYRLDPAKLFLTDEALDYTLVAIRHNDANDSSIEQCQYLQMFPKLQNIMLGEYVSIIQHPQGGMKSVTLRENEVKSIAGDYIHYLTDTQPGSSGSPVFNDQWTLVALHHAGVPSPDDDGTWIANEGILISSIVDHVVDQYDKLRSDQQLLLEELLPNVEFNKIPEEPVEPIEDGFGYDRYFLGENYDVPLPALSDEQKNDVSKMANGKCVLDYTHFSVVIKQSRGLAYFAAVNIDGANYVKIKRGSDKWHYDPRIPKADQYGEDVYYDNELDRGHLVRRMDPNWGDNAKQANLDTFHFTNCAPQHKNLNQRIWLNLEDYILKNAKAHDLRVSVFSGPVFRSDDMVYRDKYKIPAEFWKVVVMVKENGELSATAYLQTQKNMISNLEFAYGEYKTYQVSVQTIAQITELDFGDLPKYDPMARLEMSGIVIDGPDRLKF